METSQRNPLFWERMLSEVTNNIYDFCARVYLTLLFLYFMHRVPFLKGSAGLGVWGLRERLQTAWLLRWAAVIAGAGAGRGRGSCCSAETQTQLSALPPLQRHETLSSSSPGKTRALLQGSSRNNPAVTQDKRFGFAISRKLAKRLPSPYRGMS